MISSLQIKTLFAPRQYRLSRGCFQKKLQDGILAKLSRRSRRNMPSEMMGIDVDWDGARIDNGEEYGSSTYSSTPSSIEDVDSYGVSESMDEFE